MTQLDLLSQTTKSANSLRLAPVLRDSIQNIDTALQRILNPQDESRVQKARQCMGTTVDELSDEELEIYLTEFQSLIDHWFDDYERQTFEGVTLKQLLGQG